MPNRKGSTGYPPSPTSPPIVRASLVGGTGHETASERLVKLEVLFEKMQMDLDFQLRRTADIQVQCDILAAKQSRQ